MMRKTWVLCVTVLVLFVGFIYADEPASESGEKPALESTPETGAGFLFGAFIGATTIDGITYTQISLNPDLDFGSWGIGLDLNLEFDKNGKLRPGEWDSWQAILNKIRYVRVGHKGETFFFRLGALKDVTIGHGTIMEGFANTLYYPDVRMVGLQLDIDFGSFGFETFSENVLDLDMIATRFFIRPFGGLLDRLHIGFTFAADFDTLNPVKTGKDKYEFEDNPASSSARVYGIDVGLPLPSLGILEWMVFFDYMQIIDKGNGFSAGLMGEMAFIFNWKLEFNRFAPGFIGPFFNQFYLADRATRYDSLDTITEPYNGWKFRIWRNFSIVKTDDLTLALQVSDTDGDDQKPMMVFDLHIDRKLLFDKVEFHLSYIKKDIDSFKKAFVIEGLDTIINWQIGYMIAENVMLSVNYTKTFMEDPNNPGHIKGQEATSVQTQLKF